VTSLNSTDLETQKQSLPREESIESFTEDQPTKMDSAVPDRGLECCCEVDVCLFLHFRPGLTSTGVHSVKIQIPAGAITVAVGIMPGKDC
jgi:hypothetical protein